MSPNRRKRRDAFNRLKNGNTRVGDPNAPDYWTGRESKFECASSNDAEMQRWDTVIGGPEFRTPGWIRTVK